MEILAVLLVDAAIVFGNGIVHIPGDEEINFGGASEVV